MITSVLLGLSAVINHYTCLESLAPAPLVELNTGHLVDPGPTCVSLYGLGVR